MSTNLQKTAKWPKFNPVSLRKFIRVPPRDRNMARGFGVRDVPQPSRGVSRKLSQPFRIIGQPGKL